MNISKEQALETITSTLANMKLTLKEHAYLKECLRVLTESKQSPVKLEKVESKEG